jgi:hypothetical protein
MIIGHIKRYKASNSLIKSLFLKLFGKETTHIPGSPDKAFPKMIKIFKNY